MNGRNVTEIYFMPCFVGIGKPKADCSIVKQKSVAVKERIYIDLPGFIKGAECAVIRSRYEA